MREVYLNEFNILMEDRVYLPSSSGMLQAFAEAIPEIRQNFHFKPILFIRALPDNLIKKYHNPVVAGFSSSLWNYRLNLRLAQMVKARFPKCLIVFGGPSIPADPRNFLKQYSFVDIVVHGEGEETFSEILLGVLNDRNFEGIHGITRLAPS